MMLTQQHSPSVQWHQSVTPMGVWPACSLSMPQLSYDQVSTCFQALPCSFQTIIVMLLWQFFLYVITV